MREFTLQGYNRASKNFQTLPESIPSSTNVLITGSNSGIGLAAATQLAKRGATIHLACRNLERANIAKDEILEQIPQAVVHVHLLDISKLGTIKDFTTKLLEEHQINILVNNAGCMVHGTDKELRITADSYEVNTATNTLGTYLLTKEVLNNAEQFNLKKVITVSSGGMYTVNLDENYGLSKDWTTYPKDATMVYAQNKRQQVIFMEELAKLHTDIKFATMHPGWAETVAVKQAMPDFHKKMEGKWRSPDQGADTIVYLSLVDDYESGKFWLDRRVASTQLMFDFSSSASAKRERLMRNLDEAVREF